MRNENLLTPLHSGMELAADLWVKSYVVHEFSLMTNCAELTEWSAYALGANQFALVPKIIGSVSVSAPNMYVAELDPAAAGLVATYNALTAYLLTSPHRRETPSSLEAALELRANIKAALASDTEALECLSL